ncbi:glycosyltransferase [Planktomarina temperata]|nr:glycosyltransferase [Planktomarina temperata]
MKNLGIVTNWGPSGAYEVSKKYIEALHEEYNLHIYVRGNYLRKISHGPDIKVHCKSFTTDSILLDESQLDLFLFERWIKKNNIGLVLFNEQRTYAVFGLCRRLGVKIVLYLDYYTAESLQNLHLCDMLLCHTKRHVKACDLHNLKSTYIPWVPSRSKIGDKKIGQRNYDFGHSAGVGGPDDRKGTWHFIDLARQNKEKSFLLHIQPEHPHLHRIFECLPDNCVLKIGHEVVEELYENIRCYVYPSKLEGLGLTLYEAIFNNLFVITTDNPPMNELGTLFPTKVYVSKVDYHYCRSDGYFWPCSVPCGVGLNQVLQHYEQVNLSQEPTLSEIDFNQYDKQFKFNLISLVQNVLNSPVKFNVSTELASDSFLSVSARLAKLAARQFVKGTYGFIKNIVKGVA